MKHSSRTPRNPWPSYIAVGLALVIVALLMAGCSSQSLNQGVVQEKKHSAGYYQPIVISTGKSTSTSLVWMPETWKVQVCAEVELAEVCDWWTVDAVRFHEVEVGDSIERAAE